MINLHKQTYKIGGKPYTAVINFGNDTGVIYAPGFKHRFTLSEYEDFIGNMADFIKSKVVNNG